MKFYGAPNSRDPCRTVVMPAPVGCLWCHGVTEGGFMWHAIDCEYKATRGAAKIFFFDDIEIDAGEEDDDIRPSWWW